MRGEARQLRTLPSLTSHRFFIETHTLFSNLDFWSGLMLFRTQSAAVYGIDAELVAIEVDLAPARGESDSTSSVTIVGLPDLAVRESRDRIRAAITNCASFFPFHKTTINFS